MTTMNEFINMLPSYAGIAILMFSTFLIGYLSAWYFQKAKSRKLIDRLKKEVNALQQTTKKIDDIETIFTEIKPKIVEVVKQTQEEITEPVAPPSESIPEKNRTSYITYTKQKKETEELELNFDSFGYADSDDRDDLTQIYGIGPYIEQRLNGIGIYTYDQISRFKQEDIDTVTELIDFFPGRIERDNWVGQAEGLKVH